MANSIFSNIYKYRQRENHSPQENFLTEIFAFCLENDFDFRDRFLMLFNIKLNDVNFKITTQSSHNEFGRPDIEITFGNTVILIECKVDSGEGIGQLNNYASILLKHDLTDKHLIYLTKYHEQKEFPPEINFHYCRWHRVLDLISDEKDKEITIQLKKYLEELDMETAKNFTIGDAFALQSFTEILSKMEEVMGEVAKQIENIGAITDGNNKSQKFIWLSEWYGFGKGISFNKFFFEVGFFWSGASINKFKVPIVGLDFKIEDDALINELLIEDFKIYEFDNDENKYYGIYKPLTDFIGQEDSIEQVKKFLINNLTKVSDFKIRNLELFS